ncbi:hypothetical protein [Dactylococcopsis salina]|uniref:hypothetical protein n=1 Tax=Dactylococcopsis salina TaxID=292566 RepID=UPI0003098115|nr:hypothetical protein [Dactylococcopsis salina]
MISSFVARSRPELDFLPSAIAPRIKIPSQLDRAPSLKPRSRTLPQTPIVLPPSNLDRAPSFKPRSRTLPPTSIAHPLSNPIAPRTRISYPNHL